MTATAAAETVAAPDWDSLLQLRGALAAFEDIADDEALVAAARQQTQALQTVLIAAAPAAVTMSGRVGRFEEYMGTYVKQQEGRAVRGLSLIHISEPTRPRQISYAVYC